MHCAVKNVCREMYFEEKSFPDAPFLGSSLFYLHSISSA
jgi:hypothetical protein